MATDQIVSAPRVPASPTSIASRFSAHLAQAWLPTWRTHGGIAAVFRQADGTLVLAITNPASISSHGLKHLAALESPALARGVAEQIIAERGIIDTIPAIVGDEQIGEAA